MRGNSPWMLVLVYSQYMVSISIISVNTGNWTLECAAEIYTQNKLRSKDYELSIISKGYNINVDKFPFEKEWAQWSK